MDREPLVVTADPSLAESAARWCAAVGTRPQLATDVDEARRAWRRAPAVLVGADLLIEVAAAAPVRREHVVVLDDPRTDDQWRRALDVGAAAVVDPRHEHRLVELLGAALDGGGEACLVAVLGASGGVGSSTLAAGTAARAARRGLRTLLLDTDAHGGGLDLVLGAEAIDGVRWGDLAETVGRLSPGALAEVLPRHDGVDLLTWQRGTPPVEPSVAPVLEAARRGYDVVVTDLSRSSWRTGCAGAEVLSRAVLTVVVVAEDVRGVAAADAMLPALRTATGSVVVVSRPRRGGLGRSGVAEALGVPVVARLRDDRRLPRAVDGGRGPRGARGLRRTATTLLDLLGLDPA